MPSPFLSACPLDDAAREVVSKALEPLLLDLVAASLAAHACHWNVRGPAFGPLHGLFGALYEALDGYADAVAERIAALGFVAPGTAGKVAESPLGASIDVVEGLAMISLLFGRLRVLCTRVRSTAGAVRDFDAVTENELLDMAAGVEKWGWKLAAHLQTQPTGERS